MIEFFLSSISKEQAVPYALAIGAIIMSVTLGYMLGYQAPSAVCAEYIVEAETQTKKAQELNAELTDCQSKGAGRKIIECGSICNQQVEQALKDHRALVCED